MIHHKQSGHRVASTRQTRRGNKSMKANLKKWMTTSLPIIGLAAMNAEANLVADWRFDTNLQDSSGYEHTANFNGGTPVYVSSVSGSALSLDGTNDYLNVSTSGNNLDLSGSFAITAWLTVRAVP